MNFERLFSPLGVEYCAYFYYLTVISFVLLVVTVVGFVMTSLQGKNKMRMLDMLVISSQMALFYFVYRLQYSMCVGSLK
jgi:hypothetical protein